MSQCRVHETHRPPVGHRSYMPVGAHFREKWRSTANSRGQWRLDRDGLHRRKVWQACGLRSGSVGSWHGEMALRTLGKAPFAAIFEHFFDDFLRVFPRTFPRGRELARIRPRKALILNHARRCLGFAGFLAPTTLSRLRMRQWPRLTVMQAIGGCQGSNDE